MYRPVGLAYVHIGIVFDNMTAFPLVTSYIAQCVTFQLCIM